MLCYIAIGEAFTDLVTGNHPIMLYIKKLKAIKLPMMMPASSCSLSPLHYQIAPILATPLTASACLSLNKFRFASLPQSSHHALFQTNCIGPMCIIPLLYIAGVTLECIVPNAYQKVKATSTVVNGSQRLAFLHNFDGGDKQMLTRIGSQLIGSSDSCFGV